MDSMDLSQNKGLPVINLIEAKENEQDHAKKIVEALDTDGFLYIEGVDVDFSRLREACEWFFALPLNERMAIARRPFKEDAKNWYRGYFPVVKGEASRKEAFQCCPDYDISQDPRISPDNWMYERVPWPTEEQGGLPFREYMLEYYSTLHHISLQILRYIAIGLGIADNAFEETFAKLPLSTLRIIHYPTWKDMGETPPPNAHSSDGRLITTPDHADTGFLTLLHTFDYEGLELLDTSGVWRPVPCRPNSFVMNIGDTFSRMVGGRFKSTRHRVMDIARDRFSVPFFLEPHFYADVRDNWLSLKTGEAKTANYAEEPYGPWMINVIKYVKKFAEARHLPEFEYNLDLGSIGYTHDNHPPVAPSGSWVYNK